jgi:hypothetical protein
MFTVEIKVYHFKNKTRMLPNGDITNRFNGPYFSKTREIIEFKDYNKALQFVARYNENRARVLVDGFKIATNPVRQDFNEVLLNALTILRKELVNIKRLPVLPTINNPMQYEDAKNYDKATRVL